VRIPRDVPPSPRRLSHLLISARARASSTKRARASKDTTNTKLLIFSNHAPYAPCVREVFIAGSLDDRQATRVREFLARSSSPRAIVVRIRARVIHAVYNDVHPSDKLRSQRRELEVSNISRDASAFDRATESRPNAGFPSLERGFRPSDGV